MTSRFERHPTPAERISALPYIDKRLGTARSIVEEAFSVRRLRETLAPRSIIKISMNVQDTVADALGVARDTLRVPTVEHTEATTEFLHGEGGRSTIMRHGGQKSDTDNKIRRMQLPRNLEDFLSAESIAESAGMATAMALILQRIDKSGRVHTSQNNRSAEVAILLATAMGTTANHDINFDCINYRDDIPDEALNELIGVENNGVVPWNETIDEICAQPGLYHGMNKLMARYVGDLMPKEGNEVHSYVTHTQQTQALDLAFGNEPTRLDELGFRAVNNENPYNDSTTRLFKSGLYRAK